MIFVDPAYRITNGKRSNEADELCSWLRFKAVAFCGWQTIGIKLKGQMHLQAEPRAEIFIVKVRSWVGFVELGAY